ncbi:phosphoglycerate kinase [Halobacteriovorax sp. HLS]|uniref:phosphoglycerate kinase n=1 Tax=Halobacteriovorax sp. HLS TaxID=2234000 RepID=UPI000FD89C20|nr:phosphoglycerate kinase [Halobacteriovorax sp. HLS]
MALKFIDEVEVQDKVVIARFDFNVPLDKKDLSKITDTTRIDMALETIKYLLDNGAKKLILMSHLGRPKGKVNLDYTLEPVATYLANKLEQDVVLTESCLDRGIKTLLTLNESKIILLQNLRFHPEEEQGNQEFAKALASYADIYVNDAFGTAHRKHASTYTINGYFKDKAYGGFLMKKEILALSKIVEKPKAPFVAIVGGAKVSDKIKIIERLIVNVDHLLIGGAMAYPFLVAKGFDVGNSMCTQDDVKLAKKILMSSSKSKVVLPIDHIVSKEFGGKPEICNTVEIGGDKMALDIGPATINLYNEKLAGAQTVLWNGPMGLFENNDYAKGTLAIAKTLSEMENAFTLVGGGDSVSAVMQSGLADKMGHVSTGGGASLEFIEEGTLPGVQALRFGIDLN